MCSKQGFCIINSTNTETEQEQQLSNSKDRDYYVARGQENVRQHHQNGKCFSCKKNLTKLL